MKASLLKRFGKVQFGPVPKGVGGEAPQSCAK